MKRQGILYGSLLAGLFGLGGLTDGAAFGRTAVTDAGRTLAAETTLEVTDAGRTGEADTNRLDAKGRKQGLWIRQDSTRRLFYQGYFKDDLPQGAFIYTDHEGVKVAEAFYFRGGYASYNRFYYPDGKLLSEGYYLDRQKDSLWTYYREDGRRIRSVTYKNGLQDGLACLYDGQGRVMEETRWFRGLRQGAWWKREAQGYQSGFYHLNKSQGAYHAFYPDSGRYIVGNYDDGAKDGLWSFYLPAPSGRLYKEEVYRQNKLMEKRLFLQIEGVLRAIAVDTVVAVCKSPDGMGDVFTQSGGVLHSDESFENVCQIIGLDQFFYAHESALVAYRFTEDLQEQDGMTAVMLSVPLPFTVYADENAVQNWKSVRSRAAVPAETEDVEDGREAGGDE